MEGKDGVTFEAYNSERVAMDGTVPISTTWIPHAGHIWRTTLATPVWQLFIGYSDELMMARWPNARWDDRTVFDDTYWAHGTAASTSMVIL